MKKEKFKNILQNLFLFMISKFIPKAISFFLVPFYTLYLTTYEYGITDLINTTVSLLIPVLTLNIKDAVLRFTLDKNSQKNNIFSVFIHIIFLDFLILFFFTIFELNTHLFNLNPIYLICFDAMLIIHSIYDNINSFCKGLEKVRIIVVSSIVNSIVTLCLNIVLISIFKMGIKGYFIANCLGFLISIIIITLKLKLYLYIKIKINKKYFQKMIVYSFPMIFSAIAWWINYSSDKYIITIMIGVSSSGIYAVASKLPNIISTFQNIFMEAWSISAIKNYDKNDSDGFIGDMFTTILFIMAIICSLLMILNMFISSIMFKGEFYSAWLYVPPLLLSIVIDCLSLFIGNIFYAVKDTKSRAFATIMAALVNTILNIILIYFIGIYGAAISTLIGYFVGFIISFMKIKKYISMKINVKKVFSIISLLLIQMILCYFGNKFIVIQILIFISILFLYRKNIKYICSEFKKKLSSLIQKNKKEC